MVALWFDGTSGSRVLGKYETWPEAFNAMRSFLQEAEERNGFHWYYTREIYNDWECTIWCDVGSHTEFFRFVFDDAKAYAAWKESEWQK